MAKSREQLKKVIKSLRVNPFVLRLYTGPSMFALVNRCREFKVAGVPELEKEIEFTQEMVIKYSIQILELVANLESEEIAMKICEPIKYYVDEEEK